MPKIGGYGLATGSGVIFANSGRLFGEVFDVAFHLGEDVAGKVRGGGVFGCGLWVGLFNWLFVCLFFLFCLPFLR